MINYTIIIPHYNIPDLLGRCLRSIPERDDVQVVVVDDNSPGNENYLSTLPELKRKNVEFYVTKDGLGAGHARNVGLSHAKGKWLVFSDADDFFVSDFVSIIDSHFDDEEDVIYFNIKSCYNDDISKEWTYSRDILFSKYKETGDEHYFRLVCGEPWGKMIRHKLVVDNHILFQETQANNDFLFSVKVGFLSKKVAFDNVPIYWYVYRQGSLSKSIKTESLVKTENRMLAFFEVQKFLDSIGYQTAYYFPAHPCLSYFRYNIFGYFKLLYIARKTGVKWWLVFYETMKFWSLFVIRGFNYPNYTKYYGLP